MFTIFKRMCLTTFSNEYNLLLNLMKLVVSKFLIFNENPDQFPSGDSYEISPDDSDTTKYITLVLVGIPTRNQLGWVEVAT